MKPLTFGFSQIPGRAATDYHILIIKPSRCTNFSSLFWNDYLYVSNSSTVCTLLDSWWWAEELFETCRVSFQNKFEKLLHLVGFTIRIFHDARSHEHKKGLSRVWVIKRSLALRKICQWRQVKDAVHTCLWSEPITFCRRDQKTCVPLQNLRWKRGWYCWVMIWSTFVTYCFTRSS